MPPSLFRTASFVTGSLVVLLASGCSSDNATCDVGSDSPETAMRAFLEAAQASDLEGMRSQVFPLLTVTSAHLDEAAAFLGDAEVGDLVMWQTQPVHDRFIFRVTTADDEVLSEWEVGEMEEPHLGCYAVSWGDPPPDGPSPTPSSRAE